MNPISSRAVAGTELTLAQARAQLANARGRQYWRSLEQLASTDQFARMLEKEMPRQAAVVAEWDPIDRRDFIRLMGASMALAGLTACTKQHPEKIVPYVMPPEEMVPGTPMFYATAAPHAGYGLGVLAESHDGRPTKLEGNPKHPASLGGTDVFAQTSILDLYDPDRSQVFLNRGRVSTWDIFARDVEQALVPLQLARGAGLRILTETVTSPALADVMAQVLERFPEARWHQYEPLHDDHGLKGAQLAIGEAVGLRYDFSKAKVILSLDADFLGRGPGRVRYAHDFAAGRAVENGGADMNRLYAVECTPTLTGAMADGRVVVRPSQVELVARALARGLGIDAKLPEGHLPWEAWIEAVVRDLKRHRGAGLVVAGEQQPPVVHALALAINDALGCVGKTVFAIEPVEARPASHVESIKELGSAMQAGQVQVLVMLGGNPAYTAPADVPFAEALKKVNLAIHVAGVEDETSRLCHWHIPEAHYLETWGDIRSFDGTVSIQQPLIEPLYSGKSLLEVASVLLGRSARKSLDVVQDYWKNRLGKPADFDLQWRRWLHEGAVPGTEAPVKAVSIQTGFASAAPVVPELTVSDLEVVFQPDASMWDGRYANNAWLQEIPRPLTKIVWDNVVLLAPQTAAFRRLKNGFLIELQLEGRSVQAPVFIVPGHPEDTATVYVGGGRTAAGRVGDGTGFNAFAIRSTATPWIGVLQARDVGANHEVVTTQEHSGMAGRHHYRTATVAEYQHEPDFVKHGDEFGAVPITIMPGYPEIYSQGNQWGMVINLNACIGCNACLAACQAENNIPVVGKEQVGKGREMHWIRVDRYYSGDPASPDTYLQPVTCMQCENAPCEAVCPVAATTHSNDGLNQMIYNRCVGTRYCSNNCPYKVRRFNFLKFADHTTPSLKLQRNPDVTVRARGVMEKCTYCVQRISKARIEAKKQGRLVAEGEVVTACQQACPTKAIVFGDINNPDSAVSRQRKSTLNYGVLVELNTRPRTTYLARVTNPNPELAPAAAPSTSHGHS